MATVNKRKKGGVEVFIYFLQTTDLLDNKRAYRHKFHPARCQLILYVLHPECG